MFKDQYNQQMDEITPSPSLNEETLALMQEAQEHPLPMPSKPQKMRWILPVCVSGAAAMLALTVGLSVWLSRPELMNDLKGQGELFLSVDSSVSGTIGNEEDPFVKDETTENSGDALGGAQNNASAGNSSSAPQDDTATDTGTAVTDPETSDTATPPEENKGNASDNSATENENYAPNQGADNDTQDSFDGAAPDSSPPEQSTPPAEAVDPKAPVEITDKKTETYLSLRAYLDALSAKKTIGYKTNYLMEESLVLVPSWLPTTARFRQIYAYSNGGYEYSYLIADEAKNYYFLNVSVSATQPRTQRDLKVRVNGVKTEETMLKKTANQWIYYFGAHDRATVTVKTVDGKAVPMEQAAPMLTTLQFARYTPQNGLVEMTY